MYTVSLQLLVKGDFSKFLEELLFGTYRGSFCYFTKSDSTTDALPAILKNLQTNKGNTCGGLTFPYSHRWVDWAELFKRIGTKDVCLIILQNFHNSSFSNIPSKMYEDIFLEAFS